MYNAMSETRSFWCLELEHELPCGFFHSRLADQKTKDQSFDKIHAKWQKRFGVLRDMSHSLSVRMIRVHSPWAYSQEPGRSNSKMQWFSVILAFRVWYHLPPEWHLRVWPLVSCKYRISNALPVSSDCRKSRLHIVKMKQLASRWFCSGHLAPAFATTCGKAHHDGTCVFSSYFQMFEKFDDLPWRSENV